VAGDGVRCGLIPAPSPGWLAVMAVERCGEGVRRRVADPCGDLGEGCVVGTEQVARQCHAPIGQVLHRSLSKQAGDESGEGRSGHSADCGQLGHRPWVRRVVVDGFQRGIQARVRLCVVPTGRRVVLAQVCADRRYQDDVQKTIEYCLLTGELVANSTAREVITLCSESSSGARK
jgi:hypothetical protein